MAINVKLLREIEKLILEEPRRYSQNLTLCHYARSDGYPHPEEYSHIPPCGTIGCIAGWACALTGRTEKSRREFSWMRARKALYLTREQADRLFASVYTGEWASEGLNLWPEKFVKAYCRAKTPQQKTRVAVRRIEHFIKTKGRE